MSATTQVKLNVSALGGVIQTENSGTLQTAADGTITVNASDVPSLLRAGAIYVNTTVKSQRISAPIVGAVGQIVASAALSNGTKTIAAQPDVGRQLAIKVSPGATSLTAGTLAVSYLGNDGIATVDTVNLVITSGTILTTPTSKGALTVTSVIATGVTGGTSPVFQVDTTNALALAVDPGYSGLTVVKEADDNTNVTIGTVASSAACVTPSTTPNGTHNYDFTYYATAGSVA